MDATFAVGKKKPEKIWACIVQDQNPSSPFTISVYTNETIIHSDFGIPRKIEIFLLVSPSLNSGHDKT